VGVAAEQNWQEFSGFACPAGTQAVPMAQDPAATAWLHPPLPSHASVVQSSPSSQEYGVPAHAAFPAPPAGQKSSRVHGFPSSHGLPAR
jgi:hypothetical protein